MKIVISLFVTLSTAFFTFSQVTPFQLYNSHGEKVEFEDMIKTLSEKEIILFGELHNNPIAHWMQLKLVQELHKKKEIALGAEMIESDNQDLLDNYLARIVDQKAFDTLARLWTNHKTDYKPLVDFAKENHLDFIATNIPRRYASMVYKEGFDALNNLTAQEKGWIAPLPIVYDATLPSYKEMQTMMSEHANENLPKAQAIKDATMAHFIFKYFKETSHLFIHFNGAYHSNNYEGIFWYLKQLDEDLKISTISTILQSNVHELDEESKGIADFILVVDEDMTTTY